MTWRMVQRYLYLAQRTIGDGRALQRGRLPQRILRRQVTRAVFRAMRSW